MKNIGRFEKQLGYQFRQPELLQQALTHRSVGSAHNERLEFLGDSVLNFVITEKLYSLRPASREGELSRIRASLVNKDALASIARNLDISDFVLLGQGEKRSGGFRRASILADSVEAVLGAVLLDGGFEVCRDLILELYRKKLEDLPSGELLKDPKTRLQELLQASGQTLPVYEVINETGKDHEKLFQVKCLASDDQQVVGSGRSRRKAEQDAAAKMLERLT
ncbi:MAG: ribonuclease III [Gammaproteobacteria bacterium]|nr:MAG: ribonuclease III [Gammaproteobacteria bacterium]